MAFSRRFDEAFELAHELHRTQVRKGTRVPYISHLMAVCALVIENGGTEDQAIAALLHDAVEDQGGESTARRILERFGPEVHRLVMALSDSTAADPSQKAPYRERKESYLEHLKDADGAVLLVSAADKLHNARTIVADLGRDGAAVWELFKGKRDGSLWYYESLVEIFGTRFASPLVEELQKTMAEMKALGGPPSGLTNG
jgi:(p)ppGpp synthase/HD superfamily hydrolase